MPPRDHRSTRAWRKLRDQVVKEEPLCWLQLPGCTTYSTTADHINPVSTHPYLAMARGNLRGACAPCNYSRQDTPADEITKRKLPPQALRFFN